ncbi:MAG: nucleotidyltransferase family protein [Chlamydiota bacterium]|nr:nucleotidyltransferase family protein [Chlamydiota bacterium]
MFPEHKLLIQLSTESMNRGNILPLLFESEIDWKFFVSEASVHGIAPLLDHVIKTQDLGSIIPQFVQEQLSQQRQQAALYQMFLHQETKNILEKFRESSVNTLLFKGATLSHDTYEESSLRPSSDIDILVRKADLPRIQDIMFKCGFTFSEEMLPVQFYYQNHFHLAYQKKLKMCSIVIEIHWHLMDKYLMQATDLESIWQRRIPFAFDGVESSKFSLEDECIYLALHTYKHGYMNHLIARQENLDLFFHPFAENKLMWFVDLEKILIKKNQSISWDTITERTQNWCVDQAVLSIFTILDKLYPNLPLPQSYLQTFSLIGSLPWVKTKLFKTILNTSYTKGRSAQQRGFAQFLQKHFFTMKGELQFRLIRVIDLIEYMFPSPRFIKRLYALTHLHPVVICLYFPYVYPIHFIKTVSEHMFGLLQWIYYSIQKRINHGR